jgi:hypothetical protein
MEQPPHEFIRDCLYSSESTIGDGFGFMDICLSARRQYQKFGGVGLASLITLSDQCLASDPRDKLFAVLGLAPEADRICFKVDYTVPFDKLCVELAVHLITTRNRSVNSLAKPAHTWITQTILGSRAFTRRYLKHLGGGHCGRRFLRFLQQISKNAFL